jgi:hypothetical protein
MKLLNVLKNFFKRTTHMELYLVTVDTTFSNSLGKSLQNYGIVLANDANMARERFIQPLRQSVNPQILGALFPYVYAYKLEDITSQVTDKKVMWSYVSRSPVRFKGQQVKTPFMSENFDNTEVDSNGVDGGEVVAPPKPVAPPTPVVAEFKPPEGVTDPVAIAQMKMMFDMLQEVKSLKASANAASTGGVQGKVSIEDLERKFHAPATTAAVEGAAPSIDPNRIPVPTIPNVTSFPKGKIDRETLLRLRANIVKTNLEYVDERDREDAGAN